jgi:hypothetical protein
MHRAAPAARSSPFIPAPHLAVRNAATVDGLPYRVDDVLHFPTAAGVYLGVDEHTGERVVLKEARPHAGLAADGSDAVARLRREYDVLSRLSGLGIAPEPTGYYEAGGHHFRAEEFIEGVPLDSCYPERYPLTIADPDADQVTAYTEWALRACADIGSRLGLYGGLAGFALAMLAFGDTAAEPGLIDAGLRARRQSRGSRSAHRAARQLPMYRDLDGRP